jgi:hypothetical protein
MPEKVLGYVLLTVGLVVITFTAWNVWQVFSGKAEPVQIFNFEGISLDPSQFTPQINVPEGMEGLIPQRSQKSEPVEFISPEYLNETANLFAHIMLMGFIASIGGRFASIGVQLMRPIEVKLREAKPQNPQK